MGRLLVVGLDIQLDFASLLVNLSVHLDLDRPMFLHRRNFHRLAIDLHFAVVQRDRDCLCVAGLRLKDERMRLGRHGTGLAAFGWYDLDDDVLLRVAIPSFVAPRNDRMPHIHLGMADVHLLHRFQLLANLLLDFGRQAFQLLVQRLLQLLGHLGVALFSVGTHHDDRRLFLDSRLLIGSRGTVEEHGETRHTKGHSEQIAHD